MAKHPHFQGRYIDPDDFCNLRKSADMTRKQVSDVLDVAVRTIQNWETGGARVPWMAFRMLRILTGYALPGKAWEGWTVHRDRLYAPNGRWYEANSLEQIEQIFGMARLWRKDYTSRKGEHRAQALSLPAVLGSQLPSRCPVSQRAQAADGSVVLGVSPHGLSAGVPLPDLEDRQAFGYPPPAKPVLVLVRGGR